MTSTNSKVPSTPVRVAFVPPIRLGLPLAVSVRDGFYYGRHEPVGTEFLGSHDAVVVAVCRSASHQLGKRAEEAVHLLAGLGVEGDAHCGATVKHRSRVARDPSQPNLRQVHLIPAELHEELCTRGFRVQPGDMGENITTRGIDLLALPTGTQLHLGAAVIELTGLRNPCTQLNGLQPGLMAAVLDRDAQGELLRRGGVMAIVIRGGAVQRGESIRVELPAKPWRPLLPV